MITGALKWLRHRFDRWAHGGVTCLEAEAFVLDYVEGALADSQKRTFEAHLKACPLCIAYLEDYKRAVVMAKAAAGRENHLADVPPQSLVDAIVKALASTK
jgi:anti-sigma factor RsiW